MVSWSTLLRVLLSLSLVLNGATGAAAAVRMQVHAGMPEPARTTSVADSAPDMRMSHEGSSCHHSDGASDSIGTGLQSVTDPASGKSKHPAPDCCKSSACRCACAHAAQAALPSLSLAGLAPDHDRSVRPLALAHAEPAIPHLIRPPIEQAS
jgi:hypothetical protein